MKRIFAFPVLCTWLALTFHVSGSVAIEGYTSLLPPGVFPGRLPPTAAYGFAFSPLTDITVTSLGHEFVGSFNATNSFQLSLWNASGSELAAATVTAGDPVVGPLNDRFHPISPVTLQSGDTYYIAVMVSGPLLGPIPATISTAPEISYQGAALGLTPGGSFPNSVYTDPSLFFTDLNFEFVVPEPSSWNISVVAIFLWSFCRGRIRKQALRRFGL